MRTTEAVKSLGREFLGKLENGQLVFNQRGMSPENVAAGMSLNSPSRLVTVKRITPYQMAVKQYFLERLSEGVRVTLEAENFPLKGEELYGLYEKYARPKMEAAA